MKACERQLIELIRKGEGISTEFKTCRHSLSRDVFETVCAFLNRHGGTILFGVQDSGEVQGIAPGANPELIEGDVFRIVVKVPEFGVADEQGSGPKSGSSGPQEAHDKAHDEAHEPMSKIEQRILHACLDAPQNTPELLALLGYESRTGNFKKALSRLMDLACLEMTIPDKPRSKKQQYRLTEKGRKLLETWQERAE